MYCPWCGTEQGEGPGNVQGNEYECDFCEKMFSLEEIHTIKLVCTKQK